MITLALILARKFSKRLKRKNQLKINGISLVERTIDFACSLKFVDKVILSSDDNFIFKNKKKNNLTMINRPKKLSNSKSKSEDAIIHAVEKIFKKNELKKILILLLQPTSPFRSKKMIVNTYKKIKDKKNISLISVSPISKKKIFCYSIQNGKLIKKKKWKSEDEKFLANGNFYFASYSFLKKNRSFYSKNKTLPYIIKNKKFNIDIDTKKDLNLAKKYS